MSINHCHSEVHIDACLTGIGGSYESLVYALPIPKGYMNYNIAHLEILNIVVALKVWAEHWANKQIKVHCNNMAVWKYCEMVGLETTPWLC